MGHVDIAGHTLELSNEDKVFFPDAGITKGHVIDYYRRIARVMLPHVADRPLTLRRFPDGIDSRGFYQQDTPEYYPDWIRTVRAERVAGSRHKGDVRHVVVEDAAALIYLADQGVIEIHGWLSRKDNVRKCDRILFDLDPADEDFAAVVTAAKQIGHIMEQVGLAPHVMTTGSRGLHVMAPLKPDNDLDEVRQVARRMADRLAGVHSDTLTTEQRKDKRRGRLFLDTTRMAYGQTTVMPYSLRAKPGAPVATPLSWDELNSRLNSRKYTAENIFRRISRKPDPWRDMWSKAVSLETVSSRLDRL